MKIFFEMTGIAFKNRLDSFGYENDAEKWTPARFFFSLRVLFPLAQLPSLQHL